jgi:polyhydroxybutyrate depolymerase
MVRLAIFSAFRSGAHLCARILAIALLTLSSGCAAKSLEPGALTGTTERMTVEVGGKARTLLVYVPKALVAHAPLLLLFHGSGEDGAGFRAITGAGFDRVADRQGFVTAYLDGYQGNWNDCRRAATYPARRDKIDDEGFTDAVIARLVMAKGVDTLRVFAVGFSNGAQMVIRLALERPDRIAGIAAVSAGLPTPENLDCRPQARAVPVLLMDGTADPLNPYAGGEVSLFGLGSRGAVLGVEASARYFAERNGQAGPPRIEALPHLDPADPTSVRRLVWDANGRAPVVLYSIAGGGHVLPQPYARFPRMLGRQTGDLDAPTAIWTFFAGLPVAR